MVPSLTSLQSYFVKCIGTGTTMPSSTGQVVEAILNHPDITAIVAARLKENKHRHLDYVPAWTSDHTPGALREVFVQKENGDIRTTFSPNDHDYALGLRVNHGLAVPLSLAIAHKNTHGFIPGRGVESAVMSIVRTIYNMRGEITVVQEDIKDCFPSMPVRGLIERISPGILSDYTTLLHFRYMEADRTARYLGSGLPQGHPLSPAVIAWIFDALIMPIRMKWHYRAQVNAYADDTFTMTRTTAEGQEVRQEMKEALEAYGIKFNPRKSRITEVQSGAPVEYLGYRLKWDSDSNRVIIGPKESAYRRLTEKLTDAIGASNVKNIIAGWTSAYSLTNTDDHWRRTQEAIRAAQTTTATTTNHRNIPPH